MRICMQFAVRVSHHIVRYNVNSAQSVMAFTTELNPPHHRSRPSTEMIVIICIFIGTMRSSGKCLLEFMVTISIDWERHDCISLTALWDHNSIHKYRHCGDEGVRAPNPINILAVGFIQPRASHPIIRTQSSDNCHFHALRVLEYVKSIQSTIL